MNFNYKIITKHSLAFLIPFIVLLVVIPRFFSLELTVNSVFALAVFAFVIFISISVYRKIGHQGQMSLWIGGILVIGSVIALAGSISINDSPVYFELSARDQGFTLMGFIIGLIFLIFGVRLVGQNLYWIGRGGHR